jgi:DNA-binding response OmpR family regulator
MDRILVIDNDPAVQNLLRSTLAGVGFQVLVASDAKRAFAVLHEQGPHAIIMEPHGPGLAGEDLCRAIRHCSPRVPILVLSSLKGEVDKVLLLELGADDYITKPFSPRELVARVRAALRRQQQEQGRPTDSCTFGNVQVNFLSMEASRNGTAVQLTPQEFKVLRFLTANVGRVISEDELLQQVWQNRAQPGSRTLATHVLRLRQKLEPDPGHPIYIRTVHGAGYKFVK